MKYIEICFLNYRLRKDRTRVQKTAVSGFISAGDENMGILFPFRFMLHRSFSVITSGQ